MKKRKMYVAPSMDTIEVEVESGFCAASIIEEKDKGSKTEGHQKGTTFDATGWGTDSDTDKWQ